MLESTIVKNMLHYLDKLPNSFWYKTHGGNFQMAGLPDIIGCYQGLFIGIEVKVPGKKLRVLQKMVMQLITEAGGEAVCLTSAEELVKYIEQIKGKTL